MTETPRSRNCSSNPLDEKNQKSFKRIKSQNQRKSGSCNFCRDSIDAEDIVELEDVKGPFDITAEQEDAEFDEEQLVDRSRWNLEKNFDSVDIAMYNVVEDPEVSRERISRQRNSELGTFGIF